MQKVINTPISSQYFKASCITFRGSTNFFDKSFSFTSLSYLDKNNKYKYTFEKNWEGYEPLIIFNDSNNQSNEAMEPGENVINGKEYTCN